MIHSIALYGSAFVTATLFIGIAFGLEGLAKKASAFTNQEMCTEVTEIVRDAVESGLISEREGQGISERCFNIPEDND